MRLRLLSSFLKWKDNNGNTVAKGEMAVGMEGNFLPFS